MEEYKAYIQENLDYPKEFIEYIFSFNKIVSISIKHNGKIFKGYRAQHNNDFGIYKGGFRLHKNVSLNEMKKLAFIMSLKNRLYNLPFGGAKGGICIDVKDYGKKELHQVVKEYTKLMIDNIGVDKDVLAPDMGSDETVMQTIFEEYRNVKGITSFSVVTGKPKYIMGLDYRKKSTGYGVAYFLINLLNDLKIKNPKIGIQGFGNVGYYVAEKLIQMGYKISGVCDSKGGIVCSDINLDKLSEIKKDKGSVIYYPNCKMFPPKEFLEQEFDVLILAAVEDSINEKNVDKIKAKIIVEASNAGINLSVEKKLREKNIIVMPDIVVNGGGVFISYFEWIKGKTYENFPTKALDKKLQQKVLEIYNSLDVKKNQIRTDTYNKVLKNFFEIYEKSF